MDSHVSLLLFTKLEKEDFINERTYSIRKAENRRSMIPEDNGNGILPKKTEFDAAAQVYSISAMLSDDNRSCSDSPTDSPSSTSCFSLPQHEFSKFYSRLRRVLTRARRRLTKFNSIMEVTSEKAEIEDNIFGNGRAVFITKSREDHSQLLEIYPTNLECKEEKTTSNSPAEAEKTLKYNVSRRSVYDAENRLLSRFDEEFKRLSSRRRRDSVRRPKSALPLLNTLAGSSSHLPTVEGSDVPSTWPSYRRPFSWNPTANNTTAFSTEDSYYFGFCTVCGTTFDDEAAFDEHANSRCLMRERLNATTEMSGISWDDLDVKEDEERGDDDDTPLSDRSFRDRNYTLHDVSVGHASFDERGVSDEAEISSNASSTEVVTIQSGSWSGNWPLGQDAVADFVEISLDSDKEEHDRSESVTSGYITSSNFSTSDAGASNVFTPRTSPSTSPLEHSDEVFSFGTSDLKNIVSDYVVATYL